MDVAASISRSRALFYEAMLDDAVLPRALQSVGNLLEASGVVCLDYELQGGRVLGNESFGVDEATMRE